MTKPTHWYHAKEVASGWKGQVYHYDETGNRKITDFLSEEVYMSTEEALDAASDWAEDHDIDADLD